MDLQKTWRQVITEANENRNRNYRYKYKYKIYIYIFIFLYIQLKIMVFVQPGVWDKRSRLVFLVETQMEATQVAVLSAFLSLGVKVRQGAL